MLDSNGKRMLAYIVQVDDITSIEGADNIELARVGGWSLIVKKQEFNIGDMAVFFEIDSKLPETEWSEFLRNKHFKVKTYKLGKFGVVSQGLILPMNILPDGTYTIHTDVTDLLGVTYSSEEDNKRKSGKSNPDEKYNRMARRHPKLAKKKWFRWLMKRAWGKRLLFIFFGKKKDKPKNFPDWIKKTDEERCLIGDTKIETDQGRIRIADIVNKELNVNVKSYNEQTKMIEYKSINSYQKYKNKEDLIEIEYPYYGKTFRKNRIRCSLDHKFFTNGKYVKAEELSVGDTINMPILCYGDEVIQVIYGMLLGDSSIYKDKRCKSNNIRISTTQGESQLEYLKLKQNIFGKDNFKLYKGKSGYCNNTIYKGDLITDVNISNHILNDCFINGKKTITRKMIDNITPISLAFWYMDDGSLKHRSKEDKSNPNIILSTCGFSKEENELLVDMLINKFGVESNLRLEKNKYWSIYITTKGTKVFLDLIKDYIPSCMKYKTIIEYENLPCELDTMQFVRTERLVPIEISCIKKYRGKRHYDTIYDIEVSDNHNFFANNVLTHNCENMPWILENKEPWIKTEKIDGTSTTVFLDLTKKKPDFGVCSRNVRQVDMDQKNYHSNDIEGNVYWEMVIKYNMKEALENIAKIFNVKRVVLQGETYGASLQGNPYKLQDRKFAAFNLIFDGERLNSVRASKILESCNIPFVPIIDENYILPDDFEEFKLSADGMSTINDKCRREGFVYRSQGGTLSFKNVSREFLLKKKD